MKQRRLAVTWIILSLVLFFSACKQEEAEVSVQEEKEPVTLTDEKTSISGRVQHNVFVRPEKNSRESLGILHYAAKVEGTNEGAWTAIDFHGSKGYVATASIADAGLFERFVCESNVFVRLEKNSSESIGVLKKNSGVIGMKEGAWLRILFRGKVGYVAQRTVKPDTIVVEEGKVVFQRPTVLLTIDDGMSTDYTVIHPLFRRKSIPYTIFINPTTIGKSMYLSTKQLKKMKEDGVDIQDHYYRHVRLSGEDPKIIQEEMEKTNQFFDSLGLNRPVATAVPFGDISKDGLATMYNFRKLVRLTYWKKPKDKSFDYKSFPMDGREVLHAQNIDVQDETKGKMLKILENIENAKNNNSLIVLYFHRTLKENPQTKYWAKLGYIEMIVEKLEEEGFEFMTFTDLNNLLGG